MERKILINKPKGKMFHGRKTLIKKPKGKCSMEENILILIVWHLVMGLFRQNIIDKHEWYEL